MGKKVIVMGKKVILTQVFFGECTLLVLEVLKNN